MKFMILCDEKPIQCNHCPFFGDVPVQIASNAIDIQTKCILGDFDAGEKCPMTQAHTIFDSTLDATTPKQPVVFCHECGQHHNNINAQVRDEAYFATAPMNKEG